MAEDKKLESDNLFLELLNTNEANVLAEPSKTTAISHSAESNKISNLHSTTTETVNNWRSNKISNLHRTTTKTVNNWRLKKNERENDEKNVKIVSLLDMKCKKPVILEKNQNLCKNERKHFAREPRSSSPTYNNPSNHSAISNGSNAVKKSNYENKNKYRENPPSGKFFGYKYLHELSNKEPAHVIIEMMKKNSPFNTYLEKHELNPDWLMLILKIMRNVCLSEFGGNKCEILNRICKSNLLEILSHYLGDVIFEKNETTRSNLSKFMEDLTEFYSSVVNLIPSVALEKDFKKLVLKTKFAITNMASLLHIEIEENINKKLNVLNEKLDDYERLMERETPSKTACSYYDRIANFAPPENFRELSLYPTYDDITKNKLGFVRPNKIKGAYNDVEHYLDVQFRLIREDFIDPLRRGLKKFLDSKLENSTKKKYKFENIRLYPQTQFQAVIQTKSSNIGYSLNFDPNKKMKNFRWEYSKRFMHGSLLLFTNDNFQTYFYATVLERDNEKLKKGEIIVVLVENVETDKNFFDTKFLMFESEIFFQPYYYIMKSLKNLDDSNFPMKEYIVEGKHVSKPPNYLYQLVPFSIFEFRLNSYDSEDWPSSSELGLDEFQYYAFKSALTRDFCVIQGPPGTGKTFIGLKIVQVLLQNFRLNKVVNKLPILVVCYTNHALDQFLENILEFTRNIIRIGGQSRSEVLKNYNLRGRANLHHLRGNANLFNISKIMKSTTDEIKGCSRSLNELNIQKQQLENPLGILGHAVLLPFMDDQQVRYFRSDADLLTWLLSSDEHETQYDAVESPLRFMNAEKEELRLEQKSGLEDEQISENEEDFGYQQEIINEDEIFDVGDKKDQSSLNPQYYCIDLGSITEDMNENLKEYQTVLKNEANFLTSGYDYSDLYNKKCTLEAKIEYLSNKFRKLKQYLEEREHDPGKIKLLQRIALWDLPIKSRWSIYWNWVNELRNKINEQLSQFEAKYRSKMLQYEEYKQMEDLYLVQNASVVGMTTSGAAKLQMLLRSLHPAIVIVEEAAEVLESHVVASLTKECEHVILIGDHKQLRPSASVYELSKHYNIDVSLFERMINNGMDCPLLNVQHRMRCEISSLITPLIYPNLQNHPKVQQYENIRGVTKNLFFLEHNNFEQRLDDTCSKKNVFEAEFMVELCRYLVLQGYESSDITILTTYTGQMFQLRDSKKKCSFLKDTKCIVVDKYQGEENEIILLSLVRSNEEGKIGFLGIENRVCVALSRAKKGLYIIGNMDNLSQSSAMWVEIKKKLEEQNAIGKSLTLYCSQHDKYTLVSSPEDFVQVSEGGCNEFCGELMKCGHNCRSLCHVVDKEHTEIKCREPCSKTCTRLHPCKLYCYQECQRCTVLVERILSCGHEKSLPCYMDEKEYLCQVVIEDILPLCNHVVQRKCFENLENVNCSVACEDRLQCGHACTKTCHKNEDPDHLDFKCRKPCDKLNEGCSMEHKCQKLCFEECGKCTVMEDFELNCGHHVKVPCSTDLSKIKCFQKCSKTCSTCKSKCKKCCHEDCQPCPNKVKKIIEECGHAVRIQCSEKPIRENCTEQCKFIAPCGHKCKSLCRKPCGTDKCVELVKTSCVKPLCGHDYVVSFCYQKKEVTYMNLETFLSSCDHPCDAVLLCGHICSGNCGKCRQGRLHSACKKACNRTLVCGHRCKSLCHEICPPCNEMCNYRCKHSKCPKKCGAPCVICKEKCNWKCCHQACTRKCGVPCNREPCYEPCARKLKCGHPCIGFCGEPCPSLCRICDEASVTEIIFGYEDEPDARFVFLEDCNHTIESKALSQHLSSSPEGGEIVMKVCPLCKTPITKTLRYMDFVKETYQHVIKIKWKIFGNKEALIQLRESLTNKLQTLLDENRKILKITDMNHVVRLIIKYLKIVRVTKQSHEVSQQELKTIEQHYDILRNIISGLKEQEIFSEIKEIANFLIKEISRTSTNISLQQITDIHDELYRYHKMIDFHSVLNSPLYVQKRSDPAVNKIQENIENIIFGFKKFTTSDQKITEDLFKDLQTELKSDTPLTQAEKKMIHMAMSKDFYGGISSSGHWFTCSKGHYYCITECGGAMVESKCPDCGEKIGGQNHRYVETVRVASDMDGAVRPAWSSGIDMRNYDLRF